MKIIFDIDDTLWKIRVDKRDQVPDYDLIQVLRWFYKNGDEIYVWSAGGLDHAKLIITKLGLDEYVHKIIRKDSASAKEHGIELAFDDEAEFEEKETGVKTIKVNR